jgi:hypothetical protein
MPKATVVCEPGALRIAKDPEFTVYKKSRSTALSADPAKNLILFSYLESQGAHANLP